MRLALIKCSLKIDMRKRLLVIWILPVAYILIHGLIFDSANLLQYGARNGIAMLAGLLVSSVVKKERQLLWLLLGMATIMFLDGIVSLGQYFGVDRAFVLAEQLSASLDVFKEQARTPRIWGIHSRAHEFAYVQGVWTLLLWWIVLSIQNRRTFQLGLLLLVVIGFSSTVLSGQRAIVWPLILLMLVLYIFFRGFGRGVAFFSIMVAIVITIDFGTLLNYSAGVLERLTKFNAGNTDAYRFESWRAAVFMLAEDPFLGTASKQADEISIHNGLLNGWVKFGLPWLIFFILALKRTIQNLWRFPIAIRHRFAALAVVFLMVFYSMFHTHTPGMNDMTFLIPNIKKHSVTFWV
jgi:hypothetical protein